MVVVRFVGLANHELDPVTTDDHAIADSSHDNCVWNPVGHAILAETWYPYMWYPVLIPNSAFPDHAMIAQSIVGYPAIVLNDFFPDNLLAPAIHQIVPI